MIVAEPAATPVTTPFSSTVALSVSLDVHVTAVPAGVTSVLRATFPPTVTVIVAFPGATAVTVPFDTVAILVALLSHTVVVLSVVSLGLKVVAECCLYYKRLP